MDAPWDLKKYWNAILKKKKLQEEKLKWHYHGIVYIQ